MDCSIGNNWLSDADRQRIYQDNARELYKLDLAKLGAAAAASA